jgi:hypothetical protein
MFEQQQSVRHITRATPGDELLLQHERRGVVDEAEPLDVEWPRLRRLQGKTRASL